MQLGRLLNFVLKGLHYSVISGSLSPQQGASSGCGLGNGLRIWSVDANIFNKQSRTVDMGWSSSFGLGEVLTSTHRKNWTILRIISQGLGLGLVVWYERKVDAKCRMDWIDLTQNRDRWRSLVNAVMKLPVLQNAGNFLTCWGPVSLSGRALPRGVSRRVEFWRNCGNVGVTAWELCSATWNFGTNSVLGRGRGFDS